MANKSSKIFVGVAAILVIVGFVYSMDNDTMFSNVIEPLKPINWNEVKPRYIIEFSIPITIIEKNGNDCTVDAKGFTGDLSEFDHSEALQDELRYDAEKRTMVISCDKMHGDPSEFTVWYTTRDANAHASKYEYYIDPYDGTLGRGVDYWNQTGSIIKRLD